MSTSFIPGADTQRAFRDALGCFATGVTIVSARTESGPIGMTANSFTSLSLDPPLVLWSPAKSSDRFAHFTEAKEFAIQVLRDDQQALAQGFARQGDLFDARWQDNDFGVPVLSDCLCAFECQTVAQHDAGDHVIVLGQVTKAHIYSGKPLVFAKGTFGGFTAG